ncbi:MAG: M24 family metallopeptidase [Kiritimatiellales bacterium]|nr:M24 family metallopeptidase [Kiritimatiellales bacterium]
MKELTGIIMIAGSSPSTTNIRYLSNFPPPDPFLFMKTAEQNYLVVSSMEKGRAQKESKPGTIVLSVKDLSLRQASRRKQGAWALALLRKLKMTRVKVPADFPAAVFQILEKKGIKVTVLGKSPCPERSVKSKEEIACLRESQRAAVAGMKKAIRLIAAASIDSKMQLRIGKELLTSEIVRRAVHATLIEHDCIGMDTIIAGGDHAVDCHNKGHGPLYAGQAIVMDIFPRSEKHGYWGDITRTVCRGPASPELKKLYNTVKAAQQGALRMVKPGISGDEIHKGIQALFEKRGYKTGCTDGKNEGFTHGTGHGVGLNIHELPGIGTVKNRLEPGNVVTIEPGLYYFGLGGVRIEDTVVVTEKGWKYLAPCEKTFEL